MLVDKANKNLFLKGVLTTRLACTKIKKRKIQKVEENKMSVAICDVKIIDGELVGLKKSIKNPTYITDAEFEALIADFEDCLFHVQGDGRNTYDDSDDERATCSERYYGFSRYMEISPWENSEYFLRIDGKIRGVVFHITSGNDIEYHPFLFDNSIPHTFRMGWGASHTSS